MSVTSRRYCTLWMESNRTIENRIERPQAVHIEDLVVQEGWPIYVEPLYIFSGRVVIAKRVLDNQGMVGNPNFLRRKSISSLTVQLELQEKKREVSITILGNGRSSSYLHGSNLTSLAGIKRFHRQAKDK